MEGALGGLGMPGMEGELDGLGGLGRDGELDGLGIPGALEGGGFFDLQPPRPRTSKMAMAAAQAGLTLAR